MPFMEELRRLFTRSPKPRTPVGIDLTGTQAEGLSNGSGGDDVQRSRTAEDSLAPVHRRKPTLTEIQQNYDEVMGLVRKIGDHLDAQTQRTEKLVSLMERLPEAIDALPEMHRQNARLLEALSEHLAHSRKREETLNSTLDKLGEASGHQTEVLGLLQQQFDSSTRSAEQMTQTLTGFNETLANLAQNNSRSTEALTQLMRTTEQRESQLIDIFGRTQKWMIGLLAGVGLLTIAAIVIAVIAITR